MTVDVTNAAADTELTRRVSLPWPKPGYEPNPEYSLLPVLTSATPSTGVHAGSNVTSAIVGKGFEPGAKVYLGTVQQATTYTSFTSLSATVSMAGLTAGTLPLTVRNPNGLSSDPVNFVVT
jgi:hypothetical protein